MVSVGGKARSGGLGSRSHASLSMGLIAGLRSFSNGDPPRSTGGFRHPEARPDERRPAPSQWILDSMTTILGAPRLPTAGPGPGNLMPQSISCMPNNQPEPANERADHTEPRPNQRGAGAKGTESLAAPVTIRGMTRRIAVAASAPPRFARPRTEADRLRQRGTLLRVFGRDHRIVRVETPFRAILFRSHAISGLQVAFQHFQLLAVLEADDVIIEHGSRYRHGGFRTLRRRG